MMRRIADASDTYVPYPTGRFYMKKFLLCALLVVVVLTPAVSQLRFEVGVNAPLSIGIASEDFGVISEDLTDLQSEIGIIPIANMGLFLRMKLGFLSIGAGAKVQSLFLALNVGYPAAIAEIALGPLVVEATLGGGFFGYYVAGESGFGELDLALPELSAWLALGKRRSFRLGVGAIGLASISDFDLSTLPYLAYGGVKIVLD